VFAAPTSLPDDPASLQQLLRAALAEIERLRLMIAGLQRNRFGRRSERLNDEAQQQTTEELEQSLAEQTATVEATAASSEPSISETSSRPSRSEPAKRNRGALPVDLPRVELVIDVD
jgi:transposase